MSLNLVLLIITSVSFASNQDIQNEILKLDHLVRFEKKISACSAFSYLYSKTFEHHFRNPEEFHLQTSLIFGDSAVMASNIKRANLEIRELNQRTKTRFPNLHSHLETQQAHNALKAKTYPLIFPNKAPIWLNTHGSNTPLGPHQGKLQGYSQSDYDRSGRHNHLIFNAMLVNHIESHVLARLPLVKETFERRLKNTEEEQELRDIESNLRTWVYHPHLNPLLEEEVLNVLDPKLRKQIPELLREYKNILELIQNPQTPENEKLQNIQRKQNIEQILHSKEDIRINRIGRELSRKDLKNHFNNALTLNQWLYSLYCNEEYLLNNRLIQQKGPYRGEFSQ